MKIFAKYFLAFGDKKYFYALKQINPQETHVICEAANISQDFLNEDVPPLLQDLPNLIIAEKTITIDRKEGFSS